MQSEIAVALKVSKGVVSQWLHKAKAHGKPSLRLHSPPARPPAPSEAQRQLIPDLLSHGAEAYGFRGDVRTCRRAKQVIEWEFGVSCHRSHVARLLQELCWTPQQPMQRALQRNEAKSTHWRTHTWFEIYARAALEPRILLFVDESGFYLLPALLRTDAPLAQTPVRKVLETRNPLSMMSAITPRGWLFTRSSYEALTGMDSVHFLEHMHSQIARKLLVIWDRSPLHRNRDVCEYLANGAARHIHLEFLPPYAPDLNPDEGIWGQHKYAELANVCGTDLLDLHCQVYSAVARLRRRPQLVQYLFAGAGLPI